MRIISQNVTNYGIEVSKDTIFRINLAWCNSIDELKAMLQKHRDNKIFLDLPIKRIKTPNNRYTLDDLIPIISSHQQIKYFAVSNVESPDDLKSFIKNYLKTFSKFGFSKFFFYFSKFCFERFFVQKMFIVFICH